MWFYASSQSRFCEAPGSIGHTSALAKLRDWPGKHSLLRNSFALTAQFQLNQLQLPSKWQETSCKLMWRKKRLPCFIQQCQENSRIASICAMGRNMPPRPANRAMLKRAWVRHYKWNSCYSLQNLPETKWVGKQKCQAIEIWSRQRSQRWSPQRIRIHARNSVRVAQTTAISPAAPAHRTAWSATSSNPLGK